MVSISRYLEQKLKFKVNRVTSSVISVKQREFSARVQNPPQESSSPGQKGSGIQARAETDHAPISHYFYKVTKHPAEGIHPRLAGALYDDATDFGTNFGDTQLLQDWNS
jgi:hypothetical protein